MNKRDFKEYTKVLANEIKLWIDYILGYKMGHLSERQHDRIVSAALTKVVQEERLKHRESVSFGDLIQLPDSIGFLESLVPGLKVYNLDENCVEVVVGDLTRAIELSPEMPLPQVVQRLKKVAKRKS